MKELTVRLVEEPCLIEENKEKRQLNTASFLRLLMSKMAVLNVSKCNKVNVTFL